MDRPGSVGRFNGGVRGMPRYGGGPLQGGVRQIVTPQHNGHHGGGNPVLFSALPQRRWYHQNKWDFIRPRYHTPVYTTSIIHTPPILPYVADCFCPDYIFGRHEITCQFASGPYYSFNFTYRNKFNFGIGLGYHGHNHWRRHNWRFA